MNQKRWNANFLVSTLCIQYDIWSNSSFTIQRLFSNWHTMLYMTLCHLLMRDNAVQLLNIYIWCDCKLVYKIEMQIIWVHHLLFINRVIQQHTIFSTSIMPWSIFYVSKHNKYDKWLQTFIVAHGPGPEILAFRHFFNVH